MRGKNFNITSKLSFLIIILFCTALAGCNNQTSDGPKIGIIVPIEHKAMTEIVNGFEQTLRAEYNKPIQFKIANAQGDMNLQRAIINQFKDGNYNLIAPIGTVATEMTVANITSTPIISLAADYSQTQREQLKTCNIAVVHDEIPPVTLLKFIHTVYPNLSNLVLIHSTADQIYPQVQQSVDAGKTLGITIKPLMITSLSELYTIANAIPANTQGIFILKDNLIVSGISTLILTAQQRHIPLITSDEGSVENGANFSLGVFEKEIGIQGAHLANQVLSGKAACQLPIVEMQNLTVFINKASLAKMGLTPDSIVNAAKQLNYQVDEVSGAQNG